MKSKRTVPGWRSLFQACRWAFFRENSNTRFIAERTCCGRRPSPEQTSSPSPRNMKLGYVLYRKDSDETFAIGVRHADREEGYNPAWINRVFALYNAPPGTWQRMAVYFCLSPSDARACRESVMAYTHGDRYKPLPGYKTLVTHFHVAFTKELMDSGDLDAEPQWIPMMKALGINI